VGRVDVAGMADVDSRGEADFGSETSAADDLMKWVFA
jgi:hypothetical protein